MEDSRREGCDGDDEYDHKTAIKSPVTSLGFSNSNICSEEEEEDDGIDMGCWFSMENDNDDNSVDELMKFLDDGDNVTAATSKVKFIENPYSSPLICQSSSSYITINGNEETCGSSFSDWESSVMASVDMGGFVSASKVDCIDEIELCHWFQGGGGGAWDPSDVARDIECGGSGGGEWDFWEYECFLDGGGIF